MCHVKFILHRSRGIPADNCIRLRMLTAGIEGNVSIIVPAIPIGLNDQWSPI